MVGINWLRTSANSVIWRRRCAKRALTSSILRSSWPRRTASPWARPRRRHPIPAESAGCWPSRPPRQLVTAPVFPPTRILSANSNNNQSRQPHFLQWTANRRRLCRAASILCTLRTAALVIYRWLTTPPPLWTQWAAVIYTTNPVIIFIIPPAVITVEQIQCHEQ